MQPNVKETKVKKGEVFSVSKRKYLIVDKRLIPVRTPFSVKLRTLFGKKEPYPLTKIGKMDYYRISRNRYVLYKSELYPCFDFYDFADEDRFFRVYYLCRSLAEVRQKYEYITSGAMGSYNCNPSEKHRAKMCPYVYFNDGDHVKTVSVYEMGTTNDNKFYLEKWFNKGLEYFNAGDHAQAVQWFRKAAEQGYMEAQYNLGFCYRTGKGVTQDYAQAAVWYRKAAEQGYAKAQYNLGVCYRKGDGVTQDYTRAIQWWRKAAEQGYAEAQYNLGVYYHNGDGVTRNYTQAVRWYRKAAEQGDAPAQTSLGQCYDKGEGVKKNEATALDWYRKAAAGGDATGQMRLAGKYDMGVKGALAKDGNMALYWYEKALDSGDLNYFEKLLTGAQIEKLKSSGYSSSSAQK